MVSARVTASIAPLLIAMVLSSPAFAGQKSTKVHHRHVTHKQSQPQAASDRVEVINGSTRRIEELDARQPANGSSGSAKSVVAENRVDVINGLSRQSQVFKTEQSQQVKGPAHKRKSRSVSKSRNMAASKAVPDVEILNGSRLETRAFDATQAEPPLAERERLRRQKVVVGVESAEAARRRGNVTRVVSKVATPESESLVAKANPVVVAIASSETKSSMDARPAPAWTPPSGPPKRPPYHPDPLSPK